VKSQSVRLFDMFVLGPFFVCAGARKSDLPGWMRVGLVIGGAGTVAYNGINYLKKRKRLKER